jgi:hypothetical protein
MVGRVGDRIVVESVHVGEGDREGTILDVETTPSGTHYRVRWDDGHESLFLPQAGSARFVPAHRKRGAGSAGSR